MGARERLPVGRRDVYRCGVARAPRGIEVGMRKRLPVEQVDVYSPLEGGHLKLFRWAFANGAPCDGDTVQLAKEKGYVEEDWEAILAPRVVPMGAR